MLGRGASLVTTIAGLINQGKVELYVERDATTLRDLEGQAFWDMQNFLCDLVPEVDVPSATLMALIEELVKKGSGDGMANRPNEAFRKWCARDVNRAEEILASAREGDELAMRHLGLALEASGAEKIALALLSEEHQKEVHLGAITALGRIDLGAELGRTAVSAVEHFACDHAEEFVRNNALISTFAILAKHADLDRTSAKAALARATEEASADTLHAIATVLRLHGGSMTDEEVSTALKSLEDVDPNHARTLSTVDMSITGLVSAGHFDQLTDFVKVYAKRTKAHDPLEIFGGLKSVLLGNNDSLVRTFVDWFLDGDSSLCASLSSVLMRIDGKEVRLSFNRVEEVPYLVVGGDLLHSEEREAVRETAAFGEQLLMGEKGRRLGEEHGESRHADIDHGVLTVLAAAQVEHVGATFPQAGEISAEQLHGEGGITELPRGESPGGGIPEKIVENQRVLHFRITSDPPGGSEKRNGK